jgi:hypothetical protein
MLPRWPSLMLALAMLLGPAAGAVTLPAPARAAAQTLYVDGKHGSDGNSGLSWNDALKTINRAARKVPDLASAAGWTVEVRGYTDYIYRERPVPGNWDRWGTASAPVVFTAEGWSPGATDYVKPIVSGALLAPQPGRSWQADGTSGVWSTAWDSAPVGFDRAKPYTGAVFQNRTTRLWQHASLTDLRARARAGKGGYWYDAGAHRLYVATRNGAAPGSVTIDVPMRMGFYFTGAAGSRHVTVRGFVVQHTSMGITFHLGADNGIAVDNEGIGNTPMAFGTSGRVTGNGVDHAVGNVFRRNTAAYSTLQGIKVDAGSQGTVICENDIHHNAVQGIKVQGPPNASDPRVTSGTEICDNVLAHQDARRMGAGRQDEQPNGLTLANGARGTNVHHNTIRDNIVGIQVNQGNIGAPIDNTVLTRNLIHGNRTAGLSLRDGVRSSRSGSGSLAASYNLYWDNAVGIRVNPGSTNKAFRHETVYDNRTSGVIVGCACAGATASATFSESLITHNGDHGAYVAGGHRLRLRYTGLPSNGDGAVAGRASKYRINTRGAGYLSRTPGGAEFLRIGAGSFQYTAGLDDGPIGARY